MKKIVALITVALILVTSLASCNTGGTMQGNNGQNSGGNSGQNSNQTNTETVYEKLEKMEFASNSEFNVKIVTDKNGKILTSTYNVKDENGGKSISYTEENFSTFENVNGEFIIPENYKTVTKGVSFVSGNEVTVTSGSESLAELKEMNLPKFTFKESYFTDTQYNSSMFTAKVTNPSLFLGTAISCLDMTVSVSYGKTILNVMLTYKTSDNTLVNVTYTFY